MKTIADLKTTKGIANSSWIDELSEEEEYVLRHGAKIDAAMKKNNPIKIGILE